MKAGGLVNCHRELENTFDDGVSENPRVYKKIIVLKIKNRRCMLIVGISCLVLGFCEKHYLCHFRTSLFVFLGMTAWYSCMHTVILVGILGRKSSGLDKSA